MSDLDHLVAAVCLDPADFPRLVLADFLEERDMPGDAARAELIRVGCELAALKPPRVWRAFLQEHRTTSHPPLRGRPTEVAVVAQAASEPEFAGPLDLLQAGRGGPRIDDLLVESVEPNGHGVFVVRLRGAPPWPHRDEAAPLLLRQHELLFSLGYRAAECGEPFWTDGGNDFSVERGFPAEIRLPRSSFPTLRFGELAESLAGWPPPAVDVAELNMVTGAAREGPAEPIYRLAVQAGHRDCMTRFGEGAAFVSLTGRQANAFCLQHLDETRRRQIADGNFRANLL